MNEIKRVLRQRYVEKVKIEAMEVERRHTIEFFQCEDSKDLSSAPTFQWQENTRGHMLWDMTGKDKGQIDRHQKSLKQDVNLIN